MATRILLVETHPDVRASVGEILLRLGYRTIEACDAQAALRRLEAEPPALTIVGSIGPAGSAPASLELVRSVRQRRPGMPVLLFAAASSEAVAIEALKAGVTDYVKQPAFAELADAVKHYLKTCGQDPAP